MECRDAQFYLRLRRHATDELGPDASAALNGHLTGCPLCAADARGAASFDRAMGSAMRAVPLPGGLHGRLVRHVATKQGAILRHKAYRVGALVAAAILVACIGLGVFSSTRPTINTYEIAEQASEQRNDPEETTRQWLTERKLPDRLPLDFDYDLFVFRGFEQVKGKYVPVVVFRSPEVGGFAKVYVFAANGQFDQKDIRDASASHAVAEVVIGQDRFRGATYVIVRTGGPNGLKQFLKFRKGGDMAAA